MASNNLKDKAAALTLGARAPQGILTGKEPTRARTAVGMHAQAMYHDAQVTKENEELKDRLEQFADSNPTKLLDPTHIHDSKWANRIEDSFQLEEFRQLKDEIADAGGNVQPIKVRPRPGQTGEYEIVFGHRRRRACVELGLPVLAIIEELDDQALFGQMDRENRNRVNLRPYEQGRMYARALDEGLFPSLRKLAESVGIDSTNVSRAVALARLPSDVLNAFPSPLDLQYRWAPDLAEALQKDPERILGLARAIASRDPRPSSKAVVKELCAPLSQTATFQEPSKVDLSGANGATAVIRYNGGNVEIAVKQLPESKRKALNEAIQKILE